MKLRTTNAECFPIIIGDATITVKPLSASEHDRLRRKHTTTKRGMETLDGPGLTKEMFDRVVIDWSGISDESGNPLPCTSENKRAVAEHTAGFVGDVLREMDAVDEERRTGEQGNSEPGRTGSSTQAV